MPRLTGAVALLLGLLLAVAMGTAVGNNDISFISLVLGAGFLVGVFLFLGQNFWIAIPLSLSLADLPVVPLSARSVELPELAMAACTVVFLVRVATRKDKLQVFRATNVPILLFMAWVLVVFALNPIGLMSFGAETGGARFYVKLGLAFMSFFIMSCREYTEQDVKRLLVLIIASSFATAVWLFIKVTFLEIAPDLNPGGAPDEDNFYTWHQGLTAPAATIVYVIFSRWSPREVFGLQRPWLMVSYAFSVLLVLLSGKRMGIPAIILPPIISAILHKQYKYVIIAMFIVITSLGVLLVGHGQLFHLPLTTQRALSFLPGDWDPELDAMRGGTDEWRAELRRIAWEMTMKSPLIGKGFAMDVNEALAAVAMSKQGGGIDVQVGAYAVGRSWHNRWFGYAADFGIPLPILLAITYIVILYVSYKAYRYFGNSNWLGAFAVYAFLTTAKDVMASHTSGHSAGDAFMTWWMYGMVIAIYAQSRAAIRLQHSGNLRHATPNYSSKQIATTATQHSFTARE